MFRTCEYFTPALLPQKHNVMNAKTIVDSQHQKLHKSRRYTATIFANLNVAMNDRDSFFQVFFVLICKDTVVRHFKYSACFTGSEQLS